MSADEALARVDGWLRRYGIREETEVRDSMRELRGEVLKLRQDDEALRAWVSRLREERRELASKVDELEQNKKLLLSINESLRHERDQARASLTSVREALKALAAAAGE